MYIMTKEEAWNTGVEEKFIPIDSKAHDFQWTRRWFRLRNQTSFSSHLPQKFNRSKPVKLLQIGVFEGMDLVWQLQNTLKHPESFAVAIDPFADTGKLDAAYMEGVYERAKHNLKPYRRKVRLIRGYSQPIMREALEKGSLDRIRTGQWDLIVIDGDHNKPAVLEDAELSLKLVKKGGWLLFDDVRNNVEKKEHVKQALEVFLPAHANQLKHVWGHRHCECYERVS